MMLRLLLLSVFVCGSLDASAKDRKTANSIVVLKTSDRDGKPLNRERTAKVIKQLNQRLKLAGVKGIRLADGMKGRIHVKISNANEKRLKRVVRLLTRRGTLQFAIMANSVDHAELIRKCRAIERDYRSRKNVLAAGWRDVASDSKGNPGVDATGGKVVSRSHPTQAKVTQFLIVFGKDTSLVDERFLKSIKATTDSQSLPAIAFEFNKEGAKRIKRLTSASLPGEDGFKRRLAILVDGEIVMVPFIQSAIGGKGVIQGNFSAAQVRNIVEVFNLRSTLRVKIAIGKTTPGD